MSWGTDSGGSDEPCRVRVMDCSSFSSSSVADRFRFTEVERDMASGCL